MTTRKQKESFVVFEDWMKYSRFLNDAEFRQLINNILNYYKGIEPVLNTSNLQEVWNDIIDDLSINVSKKQAKRDTMEKNRENNPKLNPKLKAMLNTIPNIIPDTKPDIGPDISSNIIPETTGMVDGRCEMNDGMMDDEEMDNGKMMYGYRGEDNDDFPIVKLPVSQSSIRRSEQFNKLFDENWDD